MCGSWMEEGVWVMRPEIVYVEEDVDEGHDIRMREGQVRVVK